MSKKTKQMFVRIDDEWVPVYPAGGWVDRMWWAASIALVVLAATVGIVYATAC